MLRSRIVALLAAAALAVPASGCIGDVVPKTGFGASWPAKMIGADALASRGLTGKGIKVAIVDTGIDISHPEFRGVTVHWLDLISGRQQPYDDNGHGTHVAGIVAAQGEWTTAFSGFYLKGLAPKSELIVIKAIGSNGKGDESKVAEGIDTAVQNAADVIVLSLGGDTGFVFSTDTEDAVNRAVSRGVYVVAAAGNAPEGTSGSQCVVTSPASADAAIAVGAVDENQNVGSFSCHGACNDGDLVARATNLQNCSKGFHGDPNEKPEIVAPGVKILSAWKDGKYVEASGTSQAAPMVGAVLALVLEAHPEMVRKDSASVQRMKDVLMASAKKIGPLAGKSATAHDDYYGYGLVDASALLAAMG